MRLRTILKESIATGGGGGVPPEFRATFTQWALVKRCWEDAAAVIPHSPISPSLRELITSLRIHELDVALVLKDPETVADATAAVVTDAFLAEPERLAPYALARCLVTKEGQIQNALLDQYPVLAGLGGQVVEAFVLSLTGHEFGLWEAIAPNDREPSLRMDLRALLDALDAERLVALCQNPVTPEGVLYALLGMNLPLERRVAAAQRLLHSRDALQPADVQYLSPEELSWIYEYVTSELAAHCDPVEEERFVTLLSKGCDQCSDSHQCADAIPFIDGDSAPATPVRKTRKPGRHSPTLNLALERIDADYVMRDVALQTVYDLTATPDARCDKWRAALAEILQETLGTNAGAWDRFWEREFDPNTTVGEAIQTLQAPHLAAA